MCQFKRGKGNGKALVHGAVPAETLLGWRRGPEKTGFGDPEFFGLLSGCHDQHTVQSLPKVNWLLRE